MNPLAFLQCQGLGDVLEMCGAAKALALRGHPVDVFTDLMYVDLLKLCPHIRQVGCTETGQHPAYFTSLGGITIPCKPTHLVDGYLAKERVYEDDPEKKSIDLNGHVPGLIKALAFVKNITSPRVIIHAGISDPPRTFLRWQEVADQLISDGYSVIQIGRVSDKKSFQKIKGAIDATETWSLVETLELIRQCQCIVSADSGPLHLAGASNIGIVGIYGPVLGQYRMPYRAEGPKSVIIQGNCPKAGCFNLVDLNGPHPRMAEWCPVGGQGCMSVDPVRVVEAVRYAANIV